MDGWTIAVAAAIFGAVITIAGEAVLRRRAERKAYANLISAVFEEVANIQQLADARSSRSSGGFQLNEPLPSLAWDAVMSSDQQWRLAGDKDLYSALRNFYQAVKTADDLQDTAWQSMSLSLQVKDDTILAEQMAKYSRELQRWPYTKIIENGTSVVPLLQGR